MTTVKRALSRHLRGLALGISLALSAPAGASSGDADPAAPIYADADQIADLLRAKGYEVVVKADALGDRMIQTTSNERLFVVFFYGCENGFRASPCRSIQARASFTLDKPFPIERINEWNRERRFGRAYLDSKLDPVVEMDLSLDAGGMSPALFLDHMDIWFEVMAGFDEFVFAEPEAAKTEP